jgi:hypothetical protein
MRSTSTATKGLAIAGLLMISAAAGAQDNTLGNLDAANTVNTNGMVTDPTLNDPAMADPLATNTVDPLATPTTDPMMADNTMAVPVQEEEDNDFPWGLLGLLGLAGLIPRKRKEADINVDARRDR